MVCATVGETSPRSQTAAVASRPLPWSPAHLLALTPSVARATLWFARPSRHLARASSCSPRATRVSDVLMVTSCFRRAPHQSVSADVPGGIDPTAQPPRRGSSSRLQSCLPARLHRAPRRWPCAHRVLSARGFLGACPAVGSPAAVHASQDRIACCLLVSEHAAPRHDRLLAPKGSSPVSPNVRGLPAARRLTRRPECFARWSRHTSRHRGHRLCRGLLTSARFAPARRVPTPAPRLRLVTTLSVGRTRLPRGPCVPSTPPKGLRRTAQTSRPHRRASRG